MNLYEVLGVPKTATKEEIKAAYRKRAQETHPDKGGNEATFKAVGLAYQVLTDPERRKAYDEGKLDENGAARKSAADVVMQAMQDIIEQFADKEVNLVQAIRDAVTEGRKECQKNLDNNRVSCRKIEKRMKAMLYKGTGDSPIHALLKKKLTKLEGERSIHEFGLEIAKEAEKLMSQYEDHGEYQPAKRLNDPDAFFEHLLRGGSIYGFR